MLNAKIVGLKKAAEIAGVSYQSIAYWIGKHDGIAEKIDGEWHIDAERLDAIVKARETLKARQ